MPLQPRQTNSDHSSGVRGQARPSAALFFSSKRRGVDGCSCSPHQVATALSFNARSLLTSLPVVQSTLPNATGITIKRFLSPLPIRGDLQQARAYESNKQ